MNNSTLSIFRSTAFETVYASINLEELEYEPVINVENCFILNDKRLQKQYKLCAISNKNES